MYFNHAFRKSFLPVPETNAIALASSGTTANLTAGQLGFFNAKTYAALPSGSAVPFILATGSYFTNDKIGPFHGGYQESVKSKIVNPKYITRLIKVVADSPANQVKTITLADVECGKTYRLRLDIKGSPALRYLNHNVYRTLDAFSGCCTDDCSATCTGAVVDPNVILLKWADQINENPILPSFVQAAVYDQSYATVAIDPTSGSSTIKVANADKTKFVAGDVVVAAGIPGKTTVVSIGADDSGGTGYANVVLTKAATASTNVNANVYSPITTSGYTELTDAVAIAAVDSFLMLTAAYEETKFGSCTFTPTDFYELEPLHMYASMVDESGDPCATQSFTETEVVSAAQASGLGETVLREFILDGKYRQEAYPDSSRVESLRMREIEANPLLATINRNALYDQVLILHSVPRFNNPSGTFDNDQYLLVVHVPTGTTTTALTTFITASAAAAGNNDLVLETY